MCIGGFGVKWVNDAYLVTGFKSLSGRWELSNMPSCLECYGVLVCAWLYTFALVCIPARRAQLIKQIFKKNFCRNTPPLDIIFLNFLHKD